MVYAARLRRGRVVAMGDGVGGWGWVMAGGAGWRESWCQVREDYFGATLVNGYP